MKYRTSLAVVMLAASAAAEERQSTLPALIREALRNNPEVLAAQKNYEAARQRPTQQSSLPDPTVSLGYAGVGNPLPGAGLGSQVLSNISVLASISSFAIATCWRDCSR